MIAALKKLIIATMVSWLFALWSLGCVLLGIGLMYLAAVSALRVNGIHI